MSRRNEFSFIFRYFPNFFTTLYELSRDVTGCHVLSREKGGVEMKKIFFARISHVVPLQFWKNKKREKS
jgi:hypothetical protein